MAKKKRRYSPRRAFRRFRKSKPKIPLAIVGGLAVSVLNAKHPWASGDDTQLHKLTTGNFEGFVKDAPTCYFGIDPGTGKFNLMQLLSAWTPAFVGIGIHMTIGRVVNKYLKRIPYVNI